ncbi:hypothetical protein I317_06080 [Kwoniella heveanensis CBS 569]|uniref:Major facilitator superfamily (MFS) profile domain-containing protein n=1 Tax=Kwoniella heveanensis BCC8398 TaxID=1296120 RepID=A0A1B9GNP6_9TREE|nr:hypothetical protein I316_05601 [Kwoniella heveanensis BCC8398]OCF40129.1 hypothetical protein I317_06080 [Kwoniella heveanensis CBS 569]
MAYKSRFAAMSPMLAFSCFCLLVGDMLFGYDTASFGGVLANPGFVNKFGEQTATGAWKISSLNTSLLSSLAFIGKFLGCLFAGTIIERVGHRITFYILAGISMLGIVIEMTSAGTSPGSGRIPQFIVGRIIVYVAVGLVEVCVTTYQAEIVPAPLRGFVVVSLQLFLNAGSLMATGVNKAFSTRTDSSGWLTVTGIQFLFSILLVAFVPFIPNSPRWLLSKDRDEEALAAMRKLRTSEEVANGQCEQEIALIRETLAIHLHKAPWSDLFKGTNRRRTMIVLISFTFQQITGQAFVSTYQTVFYKSNGYADQAFLYPVINGVLQLFAVIPGMFLVDNLGRRPLLLLSCSFQGLFMFLLAGLGGMHSTNTSIRNAVVASFMLFSMSYSLGGASTPYLIGAEVPNASVREKTDSIGAAFNVVWAFATNFALPYMIAALNFKVGYIFGGISVLGVLYFFFYLPETKGKVLEEIDAIFEQKFNPFKPQKIYETAAQRALGELENPHAFEMSDKKLEEERID